MSDFDGFVFDTDKNNRLKVERGISFEEIILLIHEGYLVNVLDHPNPSKYPGQKIYVVDVGGYIHLVPFEYDEGKIVLKTVYPSRKATRSYTRGKKHEK